MRSVWLYSNISLLLFTIVPNLLAFASATGLKMAKTVARDDFRTFWNKYSHRTDNNAMMLHQNAEELEELDRIDILSCLPDLRGKDAVDIGAGIGRFTAVLAQTARYVLSTDFIESFIKKNQELNGQYGNIDYQVGDAVNLQLEPESVDLVFTNWLLMYLTDKEVIQFLINALQWLRPDGYIHLRESCSEPSTARKSGITRVKTTENPTSYRFSSSYIKLFREIRARDINGVLYRYHVLWSTSVPTYIMRENNWRQVHWLLTKVKAESDEDTTFGLLFDKFSSVWRKEQQHWDSILDEEDTCWTDQVLETALTHDLVPRNATVFAYNPRMLSYHVHINAHLLSAKFHCNIWNVETNEFYYRTSLTKANKMHDHRVRFGWNLNLDSALDYWIEKNATFDLFIATELFSTAPVETINQIQKIMKSEGSILLLEPFDIGTFDESAVRMTLAHFPKICIDDVTKICERAIAEYLETRNQVGRPIAKEWKLIYSKA